MTETARANLLTLPAELRLAILSHALTQPPNTGFTKVKHTHRLILNENYSSSTHLEILLTCRQFREDFTTLAFQRTAFIITDLYSGLLQPLKDHHIESVRRIAIVAGARELWEIVHWVKWPFNVEQLQLDCLTVVMHRSAYLHYRSDFTTDMVGLLRRLQNVKSLKFVLNGANVKGFFKTLYNRLIGLVLKEDHYQRYDAPDAPNLEDTWWTWKYDEEEHSFELLAQNPKPVMVEGEYMELVKPWVQMLVADMENEEDPDPRARNG